MVKPPLVDNDDHSLFACGNDDIAKAHVVEWLKDWFGWKDVIDLADITNARSTLTRANTGPWMGRPATAKPSRISWMAVYRFEDGKVIVVQPSLDDLAMMLQLGLN